MILPAQTIRALGLVDPCCERTVYQGVTYGLGPASYDLRIADTIRLWPSGSTKVDAIEHIRMPSDVIGFLFSKSTWARMHIEHAGTVIDPGWFGVLRLEINMHSGNDMQIIEAGTGICQVVFARLESATEIPYDGPYQDQQPNQDAIFRPAGRNIDVRRGDVLSNRVRLPWLRAAYLGARQFWR